jgi:hypothetical protein
MRNLHKIMELPTGNGHPKKVLELFIEKAPLPCNANDLPYGFNVFCTLRLWLLECGRFKLIAPSFREITFTLQCFSSGSNKSVGEWLQQCLEIRLLCLSWELFAHVEWNSGLTSNFAMMETTQIFMDQAVVLKMKLKRTWIKFGRLGVASQQPVSKPASSQSASSQPASQQPASSKPAASSQPPAVSQQPAGQQPAASRQPQSAASSQRAGGQQPAASSQQPVPSHQPPAAKQQPARRGQQPAASSQ